MVKITFIYLKNKYIIENIKPKKSLFEIIINYSNMINININNLYFIYKGKHIILNNKKISYKNNITILVIKINKKAKNNIDQIACPICDNIAPININDDKISIDNCINKHNFLNLSFNDFNNIININESLIKCEVCGNNKNDYNNKFYLCSCSKYFCPICSTLHNKEHNQIEYKDKYVICPIYNNNLISYCNNCGINLCKNCEKDHSRHKLVYYKQILNTSKLNEVNKDISDANISISQYKNKIENIKNNFNDYLININYKYKEYTKIYEYLIKYINNLSNYESIVSLNNFKIKNLLKDMKNFLNKDEKSQMKELFDSYDNIKNELTIIYCANKNNQKIRLFGDNFMKNNKNNCIIYINNKKKDLCDFYYLEKNKNNDEIVTIKLIEVKTITNMSYMFHECENLVFLSNFSNWDTSKVTDMKYMFYNCSSLKTFLDISKWKTDQVTDMSYMFFNCKLISSMPDISKWETNNVKNMAYMFYSCESLSILPDISK